MTTCPDCGCRVYSLGCVNCDEIAYIEAQEDYEPPRPGPDDDPEIVRAKEQPTDDD